MVELNMSPTSFGYQTAPGAWRRRRAALSEGDTMRTGFPQVLAIGAVLLVCTACPGEKVSGTTGLEIATITPANPELFEGDGITVEDTGIDLSSLPHEWAVDNPSVAGVVPDPVHSSIATVSGVAEGTTQLRVTVKTKLGATVATGFTTVTVKKKVVDLVTVSPPSSSALPGAAVQLTAALSLKGQPVFGRPVAWSSNSAQITVDQTGRVFVGLGTQLGTSATITATADGVSGTATVTAGNPAPVLSATPSTVRLTPGGNASLIMALSAPLPNDYSLAAIGFTNGITVVGGSFPAGALSTTVKISAAENLLLGSYSGSIGGSGPGVPTLTAPVTVINGPSDGFTLNLSQVLIYGSPGGTVNLAGNVTFGAIGTDVTLASAPPDGITASFNPAVIPHVPGVNPFNVTFTLPASITATNHAVDIVGTGRGLDNFAHPQGTTINVPPVITIVGSPPDGKVGQAYSFTFQAAGGTGPPYAWSVTAGSLPAGLELDANTGVLSGKPTQFGVFEPTITATATRTGSRKVTFMVNP
jgi:hypothetical protein